MDGRKITPKILANDSDQHATLAVPITGEKTTIHLRVADNFAIGYPYTAPADGAASSGLKIVSEKWNAAHDVLQLHLEGISGATYELPIFNMPVPFEIHGALAEDRPSGRVMVIEFRKGTPGAYIPLNLTLNFPPNRAQ